MPDSIAYKPLVTDDRDLDLVPHVLDPRLLKAFAALEEDLRMVVGQIASDKEADKMEA
jgi:hypothetical protein